MGPVFKISVKMQFLVSASLLAVASAYYPLVTFPNGAVTPFDYNNPVGTYSQAGIPLHHIGKREAQLVTYANGAVAPFDPNVAAATTNHFALKAAAVGPIGYAGYLGVHPGFGKRSAQLPVNLVGDMEWLPWPTLST